MATIEAGMWLQIKCINRVWGITFDHDGIVVNVEDQSNPAKITVVHCSGGGRTSADRVISRITLEDFLKLGSNARIVAEPPSFTPLKVAARANSMIGRSHYTVLGKNCQHFGHWCYHGTALSRHMFQAGVFCAACAFTLALVGIVAMSLAGVLSS
jgi:hypothetical protein